MIVLLSPAKTLDYTPSPVTKTSQPRFVAESLELVDILKKKSSTDIQKLMKVSEKIADLNVERYGQFEEQFTEANSKQALLAFKGGVYLGLNVECFDEADMAFAQGHVRILSGLYGLLKPLDLMQPYRLEMGTKLQNKKGKNLYEFWGDRITQLINEDLEAVEGQHIINLASNEYFSSVKPNSLKGQLYNIIFKEEKGGIFKIISFNAKKARGVMTKYIVQHRISNPTDLKKFTEEDYSFNESMSDEFTYVFTR